MAVAGRFQVAAVLVAAEGWSFRPLPEELAGSVRADWDAASGTIEVESARDWLVDHDFGDRWLVDAASVDEVCETMDEVFEGGMTAFRGLCW